MTFEISGNLFPNGLTLIIQIFSTLLFVGILYGIFYLMFRLPAKLRRFDERLNHIEKQIESSRNNNK